MKIAYTKVRRLFVAIFALYSIGLALYVFNSLTQSNDRVENIALINNHLLDGLSEISKDFIAANKLYYMFETGRSNDIKQISYVMKETIQKCRDLKVFSEENNIDIDMSDLDSLIANAKLIRMTAHNYHSSWERTKTGGSTVEMEEALHSATDEPIWTSFEIITHIRTHIAQHAQVAFAKIDSQKKIYLLLVVLQLIGFIVVSAFLIKILNSHIDRILKIASALAKGNFDERVDVIGKDRIAGLAAALNETAEQLACLHGELEQAKSKAEDSSEAKSKFLSNLSHEIRTPLNCISGYSELIIESDSLEQCNSDAQTILKESEHLLSLVNTILDHSKIESGKLILEHEVFNLHQALEHSGMILKSLIKDKQVVYDLSISNNVPQYVSSDSLRLTQIIRNLLSNAAKFTDKGLIKLDVAVATSSAETAKLIFTVSDTGVGIPEDKLDSIFDGFTQVDESITRKYGGTGLGTTITKELLELFGSKLELRSVVGVGTTFRFEIEFDIPEAKQVEKFKSMLFEEQSLETKRALSGDILVVDDYQPNQVLFKAFLAKSGIQCDIANNGKDAYEMASQKRYDIIFIDIQMPIMDGYQAVTLIRDSASMSKDAYIIGISGDASAEANKKCYRVGMNHILNKPITMHSFVNSIPSRQI